MSTKELVRTKTEQSKQPSALPGFYRTFSPFSFLQSEIDRVFDTFSRNGVTAPGGNGGFWPSMEVKEGDGAIEITAELPGMDEKDIEIDARDGLLFIRGEKRSETDEKKKNYRMVERCYGAFERSIPIPTGVDASKIKASMKKGVLRVEIPKPATAKGKRIEIAAG